MSDRDTAAKRVTYTLESALGFLGMKVAADLRHDLDTLAALQARVTELERLAESITGYRARLATADAADGQEAKMACGCPEGRHGITLTEIAAHHRGQNPWPIQAALYREQADE